MTDTNSGFAGLLQPNTAGSEANAFAFIIQALINGMATATMAQVVSVTNIGTLSPAGFVTLQPLVKQVDGNNNVFPHGVLNNVPYYRMQGGTNAIILDPAVGDIGIVVFADHDITNVKGGINSLPPYSQRPPGSRRRFDMADAMYIGALPCGLGPTPTQYVKFSAAGIVIQSPVGLSLNGVQIDPSGNITAPGNITGVMPGGGTVDLAHTHGGVQAGGGNTLKPNAGT